MNYTFQISPSGSKAKAEGPNSIQYVGAMLGVEKLEHSFQYHLKEHNIIP